MAKRLVVCLDGTWNSPELNRVAGERPRYKPTNVLKTYRAVLPLAADGATQVAVYLEGVGAFVGERTTFGRLQVLADRFFGGLFGGGFEGRVKSACRFLTGNFEPGGRQRVAAISTWTDTYSGIPHPPTNARLAERATVRTTLDDKSRRFFDVESPAERS